MSDKQKRLPVTIIIPAKNEEKNIRECLESAQWADQVFVVDSYSHDKTCSIAEDMGAEVFQFSYNGGWPKKKNWAIQNLPISNDWIMILDADERVERELVIEIADAINRKDVDGYYVRWKFFFLGRWMRHCWRHGWMLRLVRKGRGAYEDLGMRNEGGWDNEVHENIIVDGQTKRLKSWLTHKSNESLSFWIKKQNEFSDWNAERRIRSLDEKSPGMLSLFSSDPLIRRKWMKAMYLRMPFKPFFIFVYLYFIRLGFLDGREGFYFCALRSCHELQIVAKMYEKKNSGR